MRKYLKGIPYLIILLISISISSCITKKTPPNVVIILADDMGYGDPQVYNSESKIPTPNIDKLASSGMRFTNAHTPSSVCTPTRYGLLTGRYAWRSNLKKSVLWMWDPPLLEDTRQTLPKMAKTKGYNTAAIGKWHLGWLWPTKEGEGWINDTLDIGNYGLKGRNQLYKHIDFSKKLGGGPIAAGFDYYFGDDVPNFSPYAWFENDKLTALPDSIKPPEMYGAPGPMVPGWDLTAVMPTITQKSVEFIKDSGDEPFLLYFALTAPHTPIAPTAEYIGKSEAGLYGDFVHEVDWTVGQIVKALEESGKLENTILLFTSDNGSPGRNGVNMGGPAQSVNEYGHYPSRPWKGMKADIFEGGHRVPFIVSWPETIKKGQLNENLVGLNDIYATISQVLDHETVNGESPDSRSFYASLLDPSKEIRTSQVHHSIAGMFSIRKGDWKLIDGKGSGGWTRVKTDSLTPPRQLYNMATDPHEDNNLYLEESAIADSLLNELNTIRNNEIY